MKTTGFYTQVSPSHQQPDGTWTMIRSVLVRYPDPEWSQEQKTAYRREHQHPFYEGDVGD